MQVSINVSKVSARDCLFIMYAEFIMYLPNPLFLIRLSFASLSKFLEYIGVYNFI